MATPSTAPNQKYRRFRVIAFAVVGLTAFLGIALFAQSTNQGAPSHADATPQTGKEIAAGPTYVRNDPKDPMAIGDTDATLVLVQWTDMRCPFCAVFSRDSMPLILKEYVDSGKVRIELNDVAFFGQESVAAAAAVRAAGNQGKYFKYLEVLYADAPEKGHPDMPREKLMRFAEAAGVPDLVRFEHDLDDPALLAAVQQSTAQAQQLGVNSVPFFVADDTAIAGAQSIDVFRQFLDAAIAEAEK